MEGLRFINMAFQFAALNHYAEMVDRCGATEGRDGDLEIDLWPEGAREAYEDAEEGGENPAYVQLEATEGGGSFVTHDWLDEDGEDPMRMICWAEMGPEKLNQVACDWWKEQGADPDKIVPGVTDLHRKES